MRNPSCCYAFILVLTLGSCAYSQATQILAADKFQNVTVLHEMPADQMGKVMNIMSAALGVSCVHCHKGYDFASEEAAKKATARKMIAMTLALNKDQFGGRTVVTCMTCHQGRVKPLDAARSATELAEATATRLPPIVPASQQHEIEVNESVAHILNSYEKAISPEPTVAARRPVNLPARRVEPDGKSEAMTVMLSADKHWEQTTVYERVTLRESYRDGVAEKFAGDTKIDLKPDEVAMIKIAGHLALGLPLSSLFGKWTMAAPVLIDNEPMRVLQAVEGELTHVFMFDKASGLLRRRSMSLPTVLGAHVVEVAYDDYQSLQDRRLPMKTIFSMPSVNWEIQFAELPKRRP